MKAILAFAALLTLGTAHAQQPLFDSCPGIRIPQLISPDHNGRVALAFVVKADGTADKVSVLNSSGYSDVDDMEVAHVRCLHFVPAKKDGVPVDVPSRLEIVTGQSPVNPASVRKLWEEARVCARRAIDPARLAGFFGITDLNIALDAGHPPIVTVLNSSGDGDLDAKALACVRGSPVLASAMAEVRGPKYVLWITWSRIAEMPAK